MISDKAIGFAVGREAKDAPKQVKEDLKRGRSKAFCKGFKKGEKS